MQFNYNASKMIYLLYFVPKYINQIINTTRNKTSLESSTHCNANS